MTSCGNSPGCLSADGQGANHAALRNQRHRQHGAIPRPEEHVAEPAPVTAFLGDVGHLHRLAPLRRLPDHALAHSERHRLQRLTSSAS